MRIFLFETDEEGNPTTRTREKAGYLDVAPLDQGENARRDMILTLEEMGFEIESSHHEDAPAQHEVDFKQARGVKVADQIITFRSTVRTIAQRHGLHATFMPKPVYQEAGSGMHVHMLLFKDGKPVFYDKDGYSSLSREAHYFIGGLLKHAPPCVHGRIHPPIPISAWYQAMRRRFISPGRRRTAARWSECRQLGERVPESN